MQLRISCGLLALVVLASTIQLGCGRGRRAVSADPDAARTALGQALDAWKAGETPDAFRTRAAITVVDEQWQKGTRLVGYELLGNGAKDGFDWQCKVRLAVQDSGGKKSEHKGTYNVSTAPKVVIVRGES